MPETEMSKMHKRSVNGKYGGEVEWVISQEDQEGKQVRRYSIYLPNGSCYIQSFLLQPYHGLSTVGL